MLRSSIRGNCEIARRRWLAGLFSVCLPVIISMILLTGCSALRNTGLPDTGKLQIGEASWYGGYFHGRITTSGERYNMHKLTAAHRILPFGTLVRVTNMENDSSVIVIINDRGPWIPGRVIDLSYAAAKKIGMAKKGIVRVRLDIIDKQTGQASWYGKPFHGRSTASGEVFDMNKLTAAHRLLPFGAIVKVTNIDNGESVMVKVNDRMPKSDKRVINVSRKAAEKLGILKCGTARVILEVGKKS